MAKYGQVTYNRTYKYDELISMTSYVGNLSRNMDQNASIAEAHRLQTGYSNLMELRFDLRNCGLTSGTQIRGPHITIDYQFFL